MKDAADLIVIPARWGSTRFPGKPLAVLAGHTLLGRVIQLAQHVAGMTENVEVVVATDNDDIAEHARLHGCEATMTDSTLSSGSERALAAALQRPSDPGRIINLQGDAPFIPAAAVREMLDLLRSTDAGCITPVVRLDWAGLDLLRKHKIVSPFSGTTCVRAPDGRAIWFSKNIIPAIRDEPRRRSAESFSPVFRHLGLYGFRLHALEAFVSSKSSTYEELEGLEQLRLLEQGVAIQTFEVASSPLSFGGIDTPDDLVAAERLIERHGDPLPS